jgi:23S rRNA (uridine2552-2'-O)-methyltransferase
MSRKLSDRRVRHDRFHQRAARSGYRARSVFKLQEIDEAHGLVQRGARVLDLGCAPGSWLQYCRERAGDRARLVGVDRAPLERPLPGVTLVVGDVHELTPAQLLGDLDGFDLVLSDMAPDTTGIRHVDQARSEALFERALDLAEATLAAGGSFLGKLFQGPAFPALVARCRARFDTVKILKPESSRTSSIEQYVLARGFAGPAPGDR